MCQRLLRRARVLDLPDLAAYRVYLGAHPDEWRIVDTLCAVTVSRFYRDRAVFEALEHDVLPALAGRAASEARPLRCWSIGCASGEEPYTLSIMYKLRMSEVPCQLAVLATDIDGEVLARAQSGCYPASALKDLPPSWRLAAFLVRDALYCLREEFRTPVVFIRQDVRSAMPEGPFDIILCRNLVFTYFDEPLQRQILDGIRSRLLAGGALVIGMTEALPEGETPFVRWDRHRAIYRRP